MNNIKKEIQISSILHGNYGSSNKDKIKAILKLFPNNEMVEASIFRKNFDLLVLEDKIHGIKIEYSFTKVPGRGSMSLCSDVKCCECNLYKDIYISGMARGMARKELE